MKDFAFTNTKIAYDGYIFRYYRGNSEKELLQTLINEIEEFKGCKIIRKPKGVILKWGATYCFEYKGNYWYCYELKEI